MHVSILPRDFPPVVEFGPYSRSNPGKCIDFAQFVGVAGCNTALRFAFMVFDISELTTGRSPIPLETRRLGSLPKTGIPPAAVGFFQWDSLLGGDCDGIDRQ